MGAEEQLKYFKECISEAKSAYITWKNLHYCKYIHYVGNQSASLYANLITRHYNFFKISERSLLSHWVLLVSHCFENHRDAASLKKLANREFKEFEKNNKEILLRIKTVRDKIFGHRSKILTSEDKKIASPEELDRFWENLQNFYKNICSAYNYSVDRHLFSGTEAYKFFVDELFGDLDVAQSAHPAVAAPANIKNKISEVDWTL